MLKAVVLPSEGKTDPVTLIKPYESPSSPEPPALSVQKIPNESDVDTLPLKGMEFTLRATPAEPNGPPEVVVLDPTK